MEQARQWSAVLRALSLLCLLALSGCDSGGGGGGTGGLSIGEPGGTTMVTGLPVVPVTVVVGDSNHARLAVTSDGNVVQVGVDGVDLERINLTTGQATRIVPLGCKRFIIADVVVDEDDSLVVLDEDFGLSRIDPITSSCTIVSDTTRGSGPAFIDPSALARVADGSLLVADGASLLRVDPGTGNRVTLPVSRVAN